MENFPETKTKKNHRSATLKEEQSSSPFSMVGTTISKKSTCLRRKETFELFKDSVSEGLPELPIMRATDLKYI